MKNLTHKITKSLLFSTLFVLTIGVGLSSCGINGHNNAKLSAVNPNDTRIYGDKGQPARQTLNVYPDDADGKASEKTAKIREKLFPK
jgi:hypothetical protein